MMDQEHEHVVVMAISFKTFGNKYQVKKTIDRICWFLNTLLHRQVTTSAYSYTDCGGLISLRGDATVNELVSKSELSV